MIYSAEFQLDEKQREILPSYSDSFPYVCLDVTIDYLIGRSWHWHNAFEIDYVLDGSMDFIIQNEKVHLEKGDAIFINSAIIHKANATIANRKCRIYAHLFSDLFLSGMYGNIFDDKYIFPIKKAHNMPYYVIHPNTPPGVSMVNSLLDAILINQEEPFGYEFQIRSIMCKLWTLLLEETEFLRSNPPEDFIFSTLDSDRIQKMITFIQKNYMEQISVPDIANAASISVRECNRCFQKKISVSPSAFLTTYRINIAVQLLANSTLPITRVSEQCGFSSPSYFTKVFQTTIGLTPKDYRNQHNS